MIGSLVAIDPAWRTLDAWWLKDHRRRWTSVTFVLDRKGVIRFIHPGGHEFPKAAPELIVAFFREQARP